MVMLGIVSGVGQQAIEVDMTAGLPNGGRKLRGILRGSPADEGPRPKMRLTMAGYGQFGPMQSAVAFLAFSPDVVATDMAAFQAGGVNDHLGSGADESELTGSFQDGAEQGVKSPFFSSRCSA
jgi:hypothetical protein